MTLYEKNLKVLDKHYSKMDVLIKNAKENMNSDLIIYEEKSRDGEPILKVERNGRCCYLGGKRNNLEAARMWVKTLGKLETNAPVFMMGVGNSTYLKELVKQTEKRIAIIIYEPSLAIFLKFLECIDLEQMMEKHLVVFWVEGLEGMNKKNMTDMLSRVLTYEMLSYSRYLILPNYDILFAQETVQFMQICRNIAADEMIQFNTKRLFSNVLIKNLYRNAFFLCEGYKTTQLVEVIPRDVTGIVVAAGPSLNKNITELKKAKGKAFIIAVDTAIKPLIRAGIKPDMFAIIDAIKPVELVKMEEARDIPLITTLSASNDVLKYHRGMKFFFNEGFQFAERIFLRSKQPIGDVSCGGSVATTAFSLLYKIGINTIILVGQDLAYTNNRSHADGTFHEVMEEQDTSHFIMVEGNYEDKVPTAVDLKSFLDWYNMYIEGCMNYRKGFRVINATEGGAKIKNTEIMTLKEAIEQTCVKEVDIKECLEKLSPMMDEAGKKWATDYLNGMPQDFDKLAVKAKEIRKVYEKLDKICSRKKIDTKEYLSILKKLKKQIEDIEKLSTYQLVSITLSEAKYILRGEQFLQENTMQKEGKEIARKGILYMENIEQCSIAFKEYTQSVIEENKRDEENVLWKNLKDL